MAFCRLRFVADGLQRETLAHGDNHRAGLGLALRKLLDNMLCAGPMYHTIRSLFMCAFYDDMFPHEKMRARS
jgi:hypothetical protein